MKQFLVAIILVTTLSTQAQIRVACIGNSITFGSGIQNKDSLSYPSQLQRMLGDKWLVKNFGVSGATLLRKGNKPYWKESRFKQAMEFNPNVVIIKLGTNDSKSINWVYKNEFVGNYISMIDTLQMLPTHPVIYICYPVPAYGNVFNIRDSIINSDIIPYIQQVSVKRKLPIINLNKALSNKKELFPDKIHPNAKGAELIAVTVADELSKTIKKIEKNKLKNDIKLKSAIK